MPLVLAHNDVVRNPGHVWDDVEGVRYHFPAKYQRLVTQGERFVYYRGVHRANGKRGPAEYVGTGRIGSVWLDPARPSGRRKAFYCAIEGYRRFAVPVPAKVDGEPFEDILPNVWRDGVRSLPPDIYMRIVSATAGQPPLAVAAPKPALTVITASDTLIIPPAPVGVSTGGRGSYRRSKQAKAVGDWAENVAVRYIEEQVCGSSACIHRAATGETPGWDIDYLDASGSLQRVEVKGTVAAAFTGIELTAAEMRAARAHGTGFWLYLVAGCFTDRPKVQTIRDPAAMLESGAWRAIPAVFAVKFGPG